MSGETSHQEHIGPYRLLSRLDWPSGVVHRAADASGRDVAIRMLPPGADLDVARMRAVLSPYVVDVLDGDPGARPPYVVSRLVPGRPLAETVAGDGPLRGATLRSLAVALAKAVAAIHRAGLGHGSLGPRSVLVVDGAPVVVDFGLVADPEGPAGDVRAWAETVLFAATGREGASLEAPGVPDALRGLLRAATTMDLSARPNAEELVAAASALDLGPAPEVPAPAPYPEAPATGGFPAVMSGTGGYAMPTLEGTGGFPTPTLEGTGGFPMPTLEGTGGFAVPAMDTGGFPMPAPIGTGGFPGPAATPDVATAAPPRAYENDAAVGSGRHAGTADVHELAVVRGWARLLAVLVIVIAGCVAVMMPVVGLTVSALAVTLLRLTRARGAFGRVEALGRTILSLPYAAVFAVGVPLMVVGVAAVGLELSTLGASALGAGAGTIALWTAPGAGGARRALESAFEPLAWRPGTVAVAGLVLGVLTLAGLVAAMSFTPSFAPLYGLQSSLEATLSRFQNSLR
ncbi:serine/threonine-protein kinase [Actinomadura harenae]|uniref:Protein kinase domain-containing protein n=1 Tax=Actinomadura harenae TaxID=2483351 RepID=A0A3M2M2G9_9ACTN|nr:hypothetical protein [Actinomadura harenae]RMI43831.1 hypothetical protein EBO15_15325 [Actinomadura harenae]